MRIYVTVVIIIIIDLIIIIYSIIIYVTVYHLLSLLWTKKSKKIKRIKITIIWINPLVMDIIIGQFVELT